MWMRHQMGYGERTDEDLVGRGRLVANLLNGCTSSNCLSLSLSTPSFPIPTLFPEKSIQSPDYILHFVSKVESLA